MRNPGQAVRCSIQTLSQISTATTAKEKKHTLFQVFIRLPIIVSLLLFELAITFVNPPAVSNRAPPRAIFYAKFN